MFPVVNTRQRILLLRYKSLVIQEQLASELHSSEKSLIKKNLKPLQIPTTVGCKQAREDTIFTSTAHEGKHESLQTVQTVQHVSAQKVPLNLRLKGSLCVWIRVYPVVKSK